MSTSLTLPSAEIRKQLHTCSYQLLRSPEVKSFLLLNMHLQVAWCVHAIDGENPSETCIDELLSKQSSLFDQLYYYLVVCIITAEMWCLFKKSKYSSTRLESLGYLPQSDMVQSSGNYVNNSSIYQVLLWDTHSCLELQNRGVCMILAVLLNETEDEDANEEYIEDTNRDAVMIAAAKLVLADTVSKDYLGPEIVSHYISHGASTTEIIKHLITSLKKNTNFDMGALFFEALKRAYERYMAHVHDGENLILTGKSYSECQDLASRLAGSYVGAAFALKKQVRYPEDYPRCLADVEKRTQDTNMVGDQGAWRPFFTFVEHLRDKHAKNEVLHGRGKTCEGVTGAVQESGEESISASDHQGHGEDDDSDGDADQPLINTIRSSTVKLRSLKVSQQGTSSHKGVLAHQVAIAERMHAVPQIAGDDSQTLDDKFKQHSGLALTSV
ncbi:unnamed protein product [Miscanthus lutarioriparius]|uniref:Uncharacterized protein n=1 Tax=Miscanthus lutarioriparius TaxID=422564 RepID=A0A811QA56_9POAL|nr:unnamed protein product [Miscanthus lutarioriparius]